MTLVSTFEPEFFDFGGQPASLPAHTANFTVVYVGSLQKQQIKYCKSAKSGVLNIGDIKGVNSLPDVYTRLANYKHKQYGGIGIAWANHRCARDRVKYRLIPDHNNGGLDFSAVDKPEIAIQFLFGFAAGALPMVDLTQGRPPRSGEKRRRAIFSDLQRIADCSAVHGTNWELIFPNGNQSFYKRLNWVLTQLRPTAAIKPNKSCYLTLSGRIYRPCNALNEIAFCRTKTGKKIACSGNRLHVQKIASAIAAWL